MCRSKAEGGQRCSAHARERYERANTALAANPQDQQAWQNFIQAQIEYASTPEGAQKFSDELKGLVDGHADERTVAALQGVIQRGQDLRERNAAVAASGKVAAAPAPKESPISAIRQELAEKFAAMRTQPAAAPAPSFPALKAQYLTELKKDFDTVHPERLAEMEAEAENKARLRLNAIAADQAARDNGGKYTMGGQTSVFDDAWVNDRDMEGHPLAKPYYQRYLPLRQRESQARRERAERVTAKAQADLAAHTQGWSEEDRKQLNMRVMFLAGVGTSRSEFERKETLRRYGPSVVAAVYADKHLSKEAKVERAEKVLEDLTGGRPVLVTPPSLLRRSGKVEFYQPGTDTGGGGLPGVSAQAIWTSQGALHY